jgi:hypothetical protein
MDGSGGRSGKSSGRSKGRSKGPPRSGSAAFEVADILRAHLPEYEKSHRLSPNQRKAVRAIMNCRTEALGGHVDECQQCGFKLPSYNSCRNRHCPKCEGREQKEWAEKQRQKLLPVEYRHCVFNLPSALRPLAQCNRALVYDVMLKVSTDVQMERGASADGFGGRMGLTALLHTWARDISYHPHVHVIATAGGLTADGRWVSSGAEHVFDLSELGAAFAAGVLARLHSAHAKGKLVLPEALRGANNLVVLLHRLSKKPWKVYAERPPAGPEGVLDYFSQHMRRVGLSNDRLLDVTPDTVTLATRDDRAARLTPAEFIRRFLLHVLPTGFVKVRHYGLWASASREQLERAFEALKAQGTSMEHEPLKHEPAETPALTLEVRPCPCCGAVDWLRRELPRALVSSARPPPSAEGRPP